MKLFRLEFLVMITALAILSWNLWNVGIASGFIDPVMHLGAQDEATYTREAITMAQEGGWMTPTFLGRWVFEKPPLLMWLSATSMKVFGIGRVSARLPAVFAGALICMLCFTMVRSRRGVAAGLAAAAMAVSSQILFTMSRHNMTDILLAAAGMCAFAILLGDPELKGRGAMAGWVAAAAAGILAKSVAGLLVLGVMGVVVGLGGRRWGRAAMAGALAVAVASPWFLYNLLLHREWFLADMGFQLLTIGTAAHQTSPENHVWFYVVRILNSDLLPLILALTGLPALVGAWRRRDQAALLAGSYAVLYFAALMVFRFHSQQYLCWFAPSLILIGGLYSPLLNGRAALAVIAVVVMAFAIKLGSPERDFGVQIGAGEVAPAPVLAHYCEEQRATDLYIFGVDDEFLSAALPLHRVHYGWIDATDLVAREHPHLAYLGILIAAGDFRRLDTEMTVYRDRLRAWGLDSTRSVATGIAAHDAAGLMEIVRTHPESDFLVARSIVPDPNMETGHRVVMANGDFSLLEARSPVGQETAQWTCGM